jgi:uncharacterized protein YodC (DUF2158 family)
MFVGHFGVGFGTKAVAPRSSLGVPFLAAQFVDLLWPTMLLGLEHVRIAPGFTRVTPLDFTDYPYSHSLLADYEQEREGRITFTGHGVYTFEPKTGRYALHWFDCMGSPPKVFVGTFEGDVLTLSHGGPGMHARMTYDLSKPQAMRSTMEMSPDGHDWNVLFDATYRRA